MDMKPELLMYGNMDSYIINESMLLSLGFMPEEIEILKYIRYTGGKTSINELSRMMPYENAKRIKYMQDIINGKVLLEDKEDLCKHLRKLWGNKRKIGINDLMLSKVNRIPRMAVVGGIRQKPFTVFNSKQYDIEERMYEVKKITSSRIIVESSKKPVIRYNEPKEIEGVLEIQEVLPNKNILVAFEKKYIRLCNRFIIVGSLRKPEFHHGLVEIIAIDGTKVYVYAKTMSEGEKVKYSGSTQRVYGYGFLPNEISGKLYTSALELYKVVCGVNISIEEPNSDYSIIEYEDSSEVLKEDEIEF